MLKNINVDEITYECRCLSFIRKKEINKNVTLCVESSIHSRVCVQ